MEILITNRESTVAMPPAETSSAAVASLASGSDESVGQPFRQSAEASSVRRSGGFYGWRVVAAAFTVAVFGWGTGFYGPPVYLEFVRQSRGWPIALVSGAVTLHFLVGLAIIPNLPPLYRRCGLPVVTLAAGIVMAGGVLGWALADAPWQLYVAALLTGVGWSALGAFTVNAIVAAWFVAKRPLALGVAFNGGSVGGVIFSPLWVVLINRIGFPAASIVVGAVMIATLGALAVLVLGRTPESLNQAPDGAPIHRAASRAGVISQLDAPRPRRILSRDRAFLTLCVGMTLALFAQTGLVAQLVSVLAPVLGTQGAGLAAGACGVAAVVGRLAVGWRASGTSDWRVIAALSLVAQAAGCGLLVLADDTSASLLTSGVVLFGFGVGNAISIPPVIANLEFPSEEAPRVIALIVGISQGAYALAPALFGLLRQVYSDQMIFFAAVAIQVAAIVAYLFGRRGGGKQLDNVIRKSRS